MLVEYWYRLYDAKKRRYTINVAYLAGGVLLEKAESEPDVKALLDKIDYLIDGPFILAQRDLTLRFRGSRNQRFLDMSRTRSEGKPVEV